MAETNTLAYYDMTTITAIKSFIVQALPANIRLGWRGLPGTKTLGSYKNP
jgi:hypothetical protein